MGHLKAGDAAPDFELLDDTGTLHRLSDRRGHWTVVYFYPKDLTPGCTTEACEFRDGTAELAALDAITWGVSPQDARTHARFRARHGLGFPLLVDAGHAVADLYGAWVEKSLYGRRYFANARMTFLVAPDGRIARVWEKVKPLGHVAEVAAELRSLTAT
jgi:peroxiredoxin Q/BCP